MKWGLALVAVAVLAFACSPSPVEPVVVPAGLETIYDVEFTVLSKDTANGQLVASGTVRNTGTIPIVQPWYVGADFYADTTLNIRLGWGSTEIMTPIEANETTFWTIRFSSPNVDVYSFPSYFITNIQAYYPAQ